MKKIVILVLISLVLFSCSKQTRLSTLENREGITAVLNVEAGEFWSHKQKFGAISVNLIPQIAVWVETTDGRYLDTLFVTQAFGKQKWKFVDVPPDETLRTSCLPVWMNKRISAGIAPPIQSDPVPDTITGATPKGDFQLNTVLDPSWGTVVLFVEMNNSFDGNDTFYGLWDGSEEDFTEEKINGQPSIVYSAVLDLSQTGQAETLAIHGHGGSVGEDGNLYTDVSGLTTAAQIADSITVSF